MTQGSANAKSGQASAGGNTIRYTVTLPDVTRLAADFQANLAARFAQVAQTFQHSAQAAYAGTRFAGTFTVASTWHSVTLVQTHPLFQVVEYPTRPHIIEPRNAQWLRFEINGRVIFTKRVHHPGTKGRRVMDGLFQQAATAFEQALVAAGYEVLGRGL